MLAAAIGAAATIEAGGWAVITLEDLPARVEAGKPLALTFTVRQHGIEALPGLKPSIVAVSGGRRFDTRAAATSTAGQYTAAIALPKAGEWVLTIDSGFIDSKLTLLPLTAVEPGAAIPPLAPADLGQQLFVAKGCVTCHANTLLASNVSLTVGPPLVPYKYQDDHLARILANPAATLPRRAEFGVMPDLNLKAGEIAALVTFINTGRTAKKSL
jgi:cytochrome c551/c552